MAQTIKLLSSGVSGKVPTPEQAPLGVLALNFEDGVLYYQHTSGEVRSITGGGDLSDHLSDPDPHSQYALKSDLSFESTPESLNYLTSNSDGTYLEALSSPSGNPESTQTLSLTTTPQALTWRSSPVTVATRLNQSELRYSLVIETDVNQTMVSVDVSLEHTDQSTTLLSHGFVKSVNPGKQTLQGYDLLDNNINILENERLIITVTVYVLPFSDLGTFTIYLEGDSNSRAMIETPNTVSVTQSGGGGLSGLIDDPNPTLSAALKSTLNNIEGFNSVLMESLRFELYNSESSPTNDYPEMLLRGRTPLTGDRAGAVTFTTDANEWAGTIKGHPTNGLALEHPFKHQMAIWHSSGGYIPLEAEVIDQNTQYLKLNGQEFPRFFGSDGQYLTTDNNGFLSWADIDVPTSSLVEIGGYSERFTSGDFTQVIDASQTNVHVMAVVHDINIINIPTGVYTLTLVVSGGTGTLDFSIIDPILWLNNEQPPTDFTTLIVTLTTFTQGSPWFGSFGEYV